jgi:SAM-dependent methyltransferase
MRANETTPVTQYRLGSSPQELGRLDAQARLSEEMTRNLFRVAGLQPGMRVLDVGSGSGAVSFLAAEFVGQVGEVVGVDISGDAVAYAAARASRRRLANVRFIQGDAAAIQITTPFDAVVGRFVLMHASEPATLLAALTRHVRPGGIIAFQEPDYSGVRFSTQVPLCSQSLQWISAAARRLGMDLEMGLKLHETFVSAGLPAPTLRLEASIGAGDRSAAPEVAVELITTLLPAIERFGIASREEIGLDTLGHRLRAEVAAESAVVILPSLIGAWAQL